MSIGDWVTCLHVNWFRKIQCDTKFTSGLWGKSGIPNISLDSWGGNVLHNHMKENVCSFVITPLNITQTDQMAPCGIGKDNNGTMLSTN